MKYSEYLKKRKKEIQKEVLREALKISLFLVLSGALVLMTTYKGLSLL